MSCCWAIVVAAGRSTRMGMDTNKVFLPLAGRSVLRRSLDAIEACARFNGIVLVLSDEDRAAYEELIRREGACSLVRYVVSGGDTRQRSVYNGLMAVPESADIIAIHDAARALVPPSVVHNTVESAELFGSGVAATLISDTIKRVDQAGQAIMTLPREQLRAVQTPQTFRGDMIRAAHEKARAEKYLATDDAALVERYIGPVRLVVSEDGWRNQKLTTPEDVRQMENQVQGKVRVGHGFDAHRLVPGRKLTLCGVTISHETGLLGHSDADVAAHALMDALLGAAGLPDIGQLFPDSNEEYKDASSMMLLKSVIAMLRNKGWSVVNCDVTIVAQQPRLSPYIEEMRLSLAGAMETAPDAVNVKATTTEHMGYEGREEGISASAVALIAGQER